MQVNSVSISIYLLEQVTSLIASVYFPLDRLSVQLTQFSMTKKQNTMRFCLLITSINLF